MCIVAGWSSSCLLFSEQHTLGVWWNNKRRPLLQAVRRYNFNRSSRTRNYFINGKLTVNNVEGMESLWDGLSSSVSSIAATVERKSVSVYIHLLGCYWNRSARDLFCADEFRLHHFLLTLLGSTLSLERHHPVEKDHYKDNKQNHVAHVLARARIQHDADSCQTSL